MIEDLTQHFGVLTIAVHIPSALSLKNRRMVLKSLKDRLRNQFNISICELGDQNKWQRATLAIAMVSNDQRYADRCFQNILSFIEGFANLELCDHQIDFY